MRSFLTNSRRHAVLRERSCTVFMGMCFLGHGRALPRSNGSLIAYLFLMMGIFSLSEHAQLSTLRVKDETIYFCSITCKLYQKSDRLSLFLINQNLREAKRLILFIPFASFVHYLNALGPGNLKRLCHQKFGLSPKFHNSFTGTNQLTFSLNLNNLQSFPPPSLSNLYISVFCEQPLRNYFGLMF